MITCRNDLPTGKERKLMHENASLKKQVKRLKKLLKEERGISYDAYELYIGTFTTDKSAN
jgi:hypothetical protein